MSKRITEEEDCASQRESNQPRRNWKEIIEGSLPWLVFTMIGVGIIFALQAQDKVKRWAQEEATRVSHEIDSNRIGVIADELVKNDFYREQLDQKLRKDIDFIRKFAFALRDNPEILEAIKGARGEKGEQGDRGPRGDKGPRGDQGKEGKRGQVGDKGPVGDRGSVGEKGPPADTIRYGNTVTKLDNASDGRVEFDRPFASSCLVVLANNGDPERHMPSFKIIHAAACDQGGFPISVRPACGGCLVRIAYIAYGR
ncbi:collagen-like protein [Candidatus Thiosymbion oneisti]|uniref:collagen-like protein n=1 Tax=Candidatus Thiosymbion oneisti TaxID=589554 RepID=UPI000A4DB58E|nr:collagen-like protein [Candidatus Thiosymbion oneisti]